MPSAKFSALPIPLPSRASAHRTGTKNNIWFFAQLDNWARQQKCAGQSQAVKGHRGSTPANSRPDVDEAARRIWDCWLGNDYVVDLENLGLHSLPDCIDQLADALPRNRQITLCLSGNAIRPGDTNRLPDARWEKKWEPQARVPTAAILAERDGAIEVNSRAPSVPSLQASSQGRASSSRPHRAHVTAPAAQPQERNIIRRWLEARVSIFSRRQERHARSRD